jgi:WD40 repeat protein
LLWPTNTEHLLIGLNEKRGGVTNSMLTAYGYGEPVPLFESLAGYQGWRYEKEPSIVPARLGDVELPGLSYSDNVHSVFETAGEISAGKGADVIRARHVLAGVLATEAAKATEWLKEVQFPVPAIAAFLVDLSEDINPSPDAFPARSPTPADDPVVGLAVVNFGDQDLLVTARQNLGVSVSDLATGDPVGETIRGMVTGSQVTAFAVAARETRLLIASGWNDGKVLLSDLLTGEQIKVMAVNPLSMAAVTGVMFAEVGEGLNVLCGRVDGRLGRWDVDSGVEVGDSFGTGPAITSLAGGRSGDRFLAVMGLNDGRLIRWDVASGKLLGEALAGHENGVMTVTVTNLDGRTRIISGGGDQTIRIWDMESGDSVGNIMRGQRGNITALAAIELDGAPLIISGSTDDTLRIWDLATQTGIGETIEGRVGEVSALAVGIVDGQPLVFSGGSKPEVGTWRLADLVPSSQVRSKVEWKNDSPSQRRKWTYLDIKIWPAYWGPVCGAFTTSTRRTLS